MLALENKLDERNVSNKVRENIRTELRINKQQLEEIIAHKTEGAILRSKVKWYYEGEKNTKYFHNLEKWHFNSKTIRYLQSANGKKLSTDVEILDETKNYYEHLYTTTTVDVNDHDNIFFPEVTETKLGNNQKESCEGLLSATECLESLKTMESGKSPGTDGIPGEFYKVFWDDLSPFLVAALNSSFTQGHLSISQRRGLITLIPKKDKPLQHLKNWRPICLLNCDYKIATKAIAARMKEVLPDLINSYQTGFLKGTRKGYVYTNVGRVALIF